MLVSSFWKGVKKGFHLFGSTVSNTIITILLFITYIIGIGIVAVPAKIAKKEFLPFMHMSSTVNQNNEKEPETYWIKRKQSKKEDFERMF